MKGKHKSTREEKQEKLSEEEVIQETVETEEPEVAPTETEEPELEADATESEESDADTQEEATDDFQQKCLELNDKNLRLMAEFDNYRKRTLKEKADLIKHASERVFVDILPLIDDFERALEAMESTEDVSAVKEGVELIYNKFIGFLNNHGVEQIPTENEAFDVDVHEAVTTFPAPSEEMKGKIIDCTTKGYTLYDKVIRFAKVVVGE
ncbi:MAG: nucleotide exchange factor GrpE [Bacteroidales bacterium]|nr:nucleotide exchange factor GrpE [Bacteroidales bacterium]